MDIPCNAAIPGGYVREYCRFSASGLERYRDIIDHSQLSTRSMDRLAKVSRTVADLTGSVTIETCDVEKAATFIRGCVLFA